MIQTHETQTTVEFVLNGAEVSTSVPDTEILAETLREHDCLSVRQACGIGICGSCTVLVDGRATSSCSVLTAQVQDAHVETSEGLAAQELSPVQRAFVEAGAFQCSFCIPGFVVTIEGLLRRSPTPSVDEVMHELEGNLCRCGSYPRIFAAIEQLCAHLRASQG